MGRRKREDLTRIAKEIECSGEYCGSCNCMKPSVRYENGIMCAEFNKLLFVLDDKRRAERCSDCHMAERLANGEKMV